MTTPLVLAKFFLICPHRQNTIRDFRHKRTDFYERDLWKRDMQEIYSVCTKETYEGDLRTFYPASSPMKAMHIWKRPAYSLSYVSMKETHERDIWKRPMNETYVLAILLQHRWKRCTYARDLCILYPTYRWNRPMKKTYERDLGKRPRKETYVLSIMLRTCERCTYERDLRTHYPMYLWKRPMK